MTHFLVHGKQSYTSADDSFIHFFEGNYTYEQLEKLALEKEIEDMGPQPIENFNDEGVLLDEFEEPVRVDIWDILQSDSPITFLTQTNKEENS